MDKFIIGIDASNVRCGGGITHLVELIQAANPERDKFSLICVWGCKATLDLLGDYPWLQKLWIPTLDRSLFHRVFWQINQLGKQAQKHRCDVLLVLGSSFTTSFRPIITICQNLLPFQRREFLRYGLSVSTLRLFLLRLVQARSFRSSSGVIFLTHYSSNVVQSVTGKLYAKTAIIPHGLNRRFLQRSRQYSLCDPVSDEHYTNSAPIKLLYVSIVAPYKHQLRVVEGVALARLQSGINFQLELVGPAYKPNLRSLQNTLALHDPDCSWAHYRGPIDYDQIHVLYSAAHVGIWASSCETFGMIILEKMGAKLPMVASIIGPAYEIIGNSALYFDPEKPEELASALIQLTRPGFAETLSHASFEKAELYSWHECATKTFAFLHSVSSGPDPSRSSP